MSDQNPKDPWSGQNQKSPPDLIELIAKLFKSVKQPGQPSEPGTSTQKKPFNPEVKSISIVFALIGCVILALWFVSGFFIVAPTDQAPILRFGKYTQTAHSGLHWIARFVESAYPVNTTTINKLNVSADMLTEDENIVTVEVAVQYRINNTKDYLFNVVDPVGSLKQATSSAMRQVIGENKLDDILTTGREKVRNDIEQMINNTLTPYQTGIEITDVNLQPAKPPAAVTAAFDDAINAREDKQKYINQAQAYQNQVVSMVSGQQSRIMQDAQAYQSQVTQEAQGNVARYLALLKPFNENPQVMSDKLYYDTLGAIFKQTTNVINDTNGHSILYLTVDKNNLTAPANRSESAISTQTSPAVQAVTTSVNSVPNNPYDSESRPTYDKLFGGQS